METKFFTLKNEQWFFEKIRSCKLSDRQCEEVFKKLEEHIKSVNFHYVRKSSEELIDRNYRTFADITSILVSVGLYCNPVEYLESK